MFVLVMSYKILRLYLSMEMVLETKNRPVLELPEDEFETKVDQWNLGQEPINYLQAENFDKTSILSTQTNGTFMTKLNKYKCAQSASTRFSGRIFLAT